MLLRDLQDSKQDLCELVYHVLLLAGCAYPLSSYSDEVSGHHLEPQSSLDDKRRHLRNSFQFRPVEHNSQAFVGRSAGWGENGLQQLLEASDAINRKLSPQLVMAVCFQEDAHGRNNCKS